MRIEAARGVRAGTAERKRNKEGNDDHPRAHHTFLPGRKIQAYSQRMRIRSPQVQVMSIARTMPSSRTSWIVGSPCRPCETGAPMRTVSSDNFTCCPESTAGVMDSLSAGIGHLFPGGWL